MRARPDVADRDRFRAHYEVLGAQRNTKILGIFTRLWKRDGKAHYLPLQPRVWGYLERNLAPSRAGAGARLVRRQRARGEARRRLARGARMSRYREAARAAPRRRASRCPKWRW